jgi:hypothetical protein
VPASAATVTAVLNDRTSTTTRHELDGASAAAPAGPHSNRTSYETWDFIDDHDNEPRSGKSRLTIMITA